MPSMGGPGDDVALAAAVDDNNDVYLTGSFSGVADFGPGTSLFTGLRRPVMVNAAQTPEYGDIRFTGHDGGDFIFVPR